MTSGRLSKRNDEKPFRVKAKSQLPVEQYISHDNHVPQFHCWLSLASVEIEVFKSIHDGGDAGCNLGAD